jgi:hypothetical protein
MKLRKKAIGAVCLILAAMLLVTGCSAPKNPYQINDEQNYNVSIRFDANGGLFSTNLSVITDCYNITNMQQNGAGEIEIPLLDPNDENRGDVESFEAEKDGYFLAGWYTNRTEGGDGEYVYSGKWDFTKDRLKVDPNGKYSAEEPVMTLYAAWIPSFKFEYYDYNTGDKLGETSFDPLKSQGVYRPRPSKQTGRMIMGEFFEREGYTFKNVYLSMESTEPITADTIKHGGVVNLENGTGKDSVKKLYVDWMEGEWFHVYSAEQFTKLAATDANLIISDDLDFSNANWPSSLSNGTFTGKIIGDGYTIKNLKSDLSGKLFNQIGDGALIENLTFKFIKGTKDQGMDMICGNISSNAKLDNVFASVYSPMDDLNPVSE